MGNGAGTSKWRSFYILLEFWKRNILSIENKTFRAMIIFLMLTVADLLRLVLLVVFYK